MIWKLIVSISKWNWSNFNEIKIRWGFMGNEGFSSIIPGLLFLGLCVLRISEIEFCFKAYPTNRLQCGMIINISHISVAKTISRINTCKALAHSFQLLNQLHLKSNTHNEKLYVDLNSAFKDTRTLFKVPWEWILNFHVKMLRQTDRRNDCMYYFTRVSLLAGWVR